MAQESLVLKQTVKQKGYWDFNELYDMCFEWFGDNGYHLSEKEYKEKISSIGKGVEIVWVAKKKVTDYFLYKIEISWRIIGMKDVEVERDGKKVSTNKGEVKMAFKANLVKDCEEKWENHPLWKFMRGVYDKYVIRTTSEEQEDKLEEDVLELISQVKSFLRMGK